MAERRQNKWLHQKQHFYCSPVILKKLLFKKGFLRHIKNLLNLLKGYHNLVPRASFLRKTMAALGTRLGLSVLSIHKIMKPFLCEGAQTLRTTTREFYSNNFRAVWPNHAKMALVLFEVEAKCVSHVVTGKLYTNVVHIVPITV